MSGFPLGVLSRLLTVLRLLYASDGCDYRLAIQRWWRSRAPVQAKGRRRGRRCGSLHTAASLRAYTITMACYTATLPGREESEHCMQAAVSFNMPLCPCQWQPSQLCEYMRQLAVMDSRMIHEHVHTGMQRRMTRAQAGSSSCACGA